MREVFGLLDRHDADPDARLLRELRAAPPLHEAREALAYWEGRLERLPRHRLRARREARDMTARWRSRVRQAELARWGQGPLGRLRRALLAPRPGVGRMLDRVLLATTAVAITLAVCAVAVAFAGLALLHALVGG
jgi:hypothetical protein